jgi:beta-lactam-binding protein with PASTA domain
MEKIKQFFKKHPWVQHVLLMIAISIILIFFISLFIKIYARQGKEFEMPQFAMTDSTEGRTISEAMSDNDLDLEFVILDSVYQANVKPGVILTQDPKAGTMIKKGRKVYVSVSAANAADIIMPELTGLSVRQAVSEIYNAGLKMGKLTFVDDPFKNNVKEQQSGGRAIYAGQKVAPGTVIDLIVGNGDGSGGVTIPFVLGKTSSQARRDIYTLSLNVGREHFDGVKDRATAVVYRQEPEYTGVNKHPFGTAIELWYIDASATDIEKMISDFKVDSSKIIIDPELPNPEEFEIDIDDNDLW